MDFEAESRCTTVLGEPTTREWPPEASINTSQSDTISLLNPRLPPPSSSGQKLLHHDVRAASFPPTMNSSGSSCASVKVRVRCSPPHSLYPTIRLTQVPPLRSWISSSCRQTGSATYQWSNTSHSRTQHSPISIDGRPRESFFLMASIVTVPDHDVRRPRVSRRVKARRRCPTVRG